MRQASSETGGRIYKGAQGGTAVEFSCRSSFLMSSIRAAVIQEADKNRIMVLGLKPFNTSAKHDEETLERSNALARDERISARLFHRVVNNLPVIKRNIELFTRIAARKLTKWWDADQLGTLVAGAWAMTSRQIATEEPAAQFLESFDWTEIRDEPSIGEGETVLATILHQNKSNIVGDYGKSRGSVVERHLFSGSLRTNSAEKKSVIQSAWVAREWAAHEGVVD